MDCKAVGVITTFVQGKKTTYQLEETTIIVKDDEAEKCLDVIKKDNLDRRSNFNSSSKGKLNSVPKYQEFSIDKKKSTSDVVNDDSFDIWQIWLVWQYIHYQMLMPLCCRLRRKFFVYDIGKNSISNGFQLFLITFCVFGSSYALNLPNVTIVTSPIVFGEDATLQCVYKDHGLQSSLATVWLKGQEKECIIYGNSSTKGEKYTSIIYHDADVYRNQMTIRNVSETDLGTYSCGVKFQEASLAFTMDENLSFIYIPDTTDIVCNISASKLNIWIPKIYPEPSCTVFCNGKDVSNLLNRNDRRETRMYSILIQLHQSECRSGDLRISCSLDEKSFNWSKNVQQCCKENECLTEIKSYDITPVILVITLAIILMTTVTVIRYCTCCKHGNAKGMILLNQTV